MNLNLNKIKELWEEILIHGEELQYQASPERAELAHKRLAIYRRYMDKDPECATNPYLHPDNYDFY